MSELYEAAREAFAKMGWAFREIQGKEVLAADFEAYHSKVSLHLQVFAEPGVISVVAEGTLPGEESQFPARLPRAAELLMRANLQLNLGAFELDWDRGLYFFRISNVFTGGEIDRGIIGNLVHTTVLEMDRMAPFISVLMKTTDEALAGLDIPALLAREDLLPEVPDPEGETSPGVL
ncbi:MAG: hypothetical protein ACC661_12690 [Verrucomicrobiales bacterium]